MKDVQVIFIEWFFYLLSFIFYYLPDISKWKGKKNHIPYYEKFITSNGYQLETHKVVTRDGYILTVWRILPKKVSNLKQSKPIILQHGLLDNSWTWFTLSPENCLPFILSDLGYDVWVPNSRGNMFSTEHINPSEYNSDIMFNKFWDFSIDEMVKYDVPNVISYVLKQTKKNKLDYIAHSQGTTTFLLAFTQNVKFFNKTVDHFGAIGMVPNLKYAKSPLIKYFSKVNFLNKLSFGNFMNTGEKNGIYFYLACKYFKRISAFIINGIIETTPTNRIDFDKFVNVLLFEPGGTSYRNIMHWLQCAKRKEINYFDFEDETKNLEKYGSVTPPKYNKELLKGWRIKTFVLISDTDPFSNEKDIEELLETFEDKSLIHRKYVNNFNHLDYVWSDDSKTEFYDDLVDFVQKP